MSRLLRRHWELILWAIGLGWVLNFLGAEPHTLRWWIAAFVLGLMRAATWERATQRDEP